jgi:hypothetical protein
MAENRYYVTYDRGSRILREADREQVEAEP